jgi:hypothetical protein
VRVAVIVKLPVFEIVTACELSTPAVNAAVVPEPAESVPVDVMSTCCRAVKPVTVLLFASRAVIRTLKARSGGLGADRSRRRRLDEEVVQRARVDGERVARSVLGAAARPGGGDREAARVRDRDRVRAEHARRERGRSCRSLRRASRST